MRIGLLGHGVVGRGVREIIEGQKTDELNDFELTRIICKEAEPNDDRFVQNIDDVIDNCDLVIECMGGLEPAHEWCLKALNKGRSVVTSNKAMMATFYDELVEAAEKNGAKIAYEASVGGGIPWINNLVMASKTDETTGFRGIMNGTTNYILYRMKEEMADFAEVLLDAQKLGYAEKDPTNDIDGYDVCYKCVLSANTAFKTSVDIQDIPILGIRNISYEDIKYASSIGKTIKLIGTGHLNINGLNIYVEPEMIDNNAVIASIPSNYNCIILENETLSESTFIGQGAGRYPTANAVVSDVVAISLNRMDNPQIRRKIDVVNDDEKVYYVSGDLTSFGGYISERISDSAAILRRMKVSEFMKLVKGKEGVFACGIE